MTRLSMRAAAVVTSALSVFTGFPTSAQTIASSCTDVDHARGLLEDRLRELSPRMRGYVREVSCTEGTCTIELDFLSGDPSCRIDLVAVPTSDSLEATGGARLTCRFPQGDCPDQPNQSKHSFVATEPALEQCLRAAARISAENRRCERIEPISDPVAPPPPPRSRVGFDLGAGLGASGSRLEPWLVAWGASIDWHFAAPFIAGARLGFAGAAGRAVDSDGDGRRESQTTNMSAFDPGLRLRWLMGKGDVRGELEASTVARLSLTDAIDSHTAVGVGALMYLRQFGFGVRYLRGFGEPALRDSVVVFVERTTRILDNEGWTRSQRESPRVGLGLHALVGGWGFARGLGLMLPGAALELPFYVGWPVVPVVRADFLWFPGIDGPALTTQSVLAGLQYWRLGEALPFGLSALGGYSLTYGTSPRVADGGPIADAGVWYWLDNLGFHLGVHARAGLVDVNRELRTVYLSLGGRQIF